MKSLFLYVGFIILNGIVVNAQSYEHSQILQISGVVKNLQEKGIPNVAVTDGNIIVYTDNKGKYSFKSLQGSEFVYISIPSGYEIPQEKGLVNFYIKIPSGINTFKADFILKKLLRSDLHHFSIVWADPQISNKEEAAMLMNSAARDTKNHAGELTAVAPVHGIAVGDLSWDAPAIIPDYKNAIAVTGIPFFQVIGNHDMDIQVQSDEESDNTFRSALGPTWYSFNRGKAHYVVLDNVFYYGDGYNYIGYIADQQLKWLEQDLQRITPGSIVFVAMHIPAYSFEKSRTKANHDHPGNVTNNRKALYELLKPFNAHILTGHTHYNENVITANVFEHIHAAICGTWWISSVCTDGTPAGYGVYEIKGDSLSWYYKPIDSSKNYQLRVYPPGTYKGRETDVVVNVWNYDDAWKVSWFEDNQFKGAMKKETNLDHSISRILSSPDRPKKHSWAGPSLTDHLFFAQPSSNAKNIRIEVIDRFGKKYEQTISLVK